MGKRSIMTAKPWTAVLVLLLLLGLAVPAAAGDVIYEESMSEPVGRGVTYRQTWRFTRDGWLRVHVLEVDLSDPEVTLDLLYNDEGVAVPRPLTEMAAKRGVVAAINGDFFYRQGSYYAPVGPMVQEGRLVTSPGADGSMGVFALNSAGRIEFGPWRGEGYVYHPGGESFRLAGVNKPGTDYAWPILYTADWGKTSPATPSGVVTLLGMDARVVRVSETGEQEIPEGGFALVAGGAAADYFRTLRPGDVIEVSYTTVPNWQNYLTAMGGGGILLKDGRIVTDGHQVEGRHPRSAVGVSADGKTLYLVAVDGRQDESRGMEQVELARLLLELGAANAINLDGGGSTTLVARPLGLSRLAVRNKLSGTSQRPVLNGLGIRTAQTQGPAAGLVLSVPGKNVLLNGTRSLDLRAYDAAYNPVPLPAGEPVWEVVPGDLGRVEAGRFVPRRSGSGQVRVRLGELEAAVDVRVIGPAVELAVSPERINLEPGSRQAFTVVGTDARGYRALVEAEDMSWEVKGEIGSLQRGILTAAGSGGSGAVLVYLDGIGAGAQVTVGRKELLLDQLVSPAGVDFLSWPQWVGGGIGFAAAPQPLPAREGPVLALHYDFTPLEPATRAAYVVLDEAGKELPPEAQAVGLWVYGDGSGHWLRGLVEDAQGQQFPMDFARQVDWVGWRYVRANLSTDGARPLTLKRVYLAEPDASSGGKGTIYLANLTAELPLAWPTDLVPEAVKREDPAQLAAGKQLPAGTRLLVVGNIAAEVDKEALAAALTAEKEGQGAAFVLTTGALAPAEAGSLPVLTGSHLPTALQGKGFSALHLRATQGGLRETDFNQWHYLKGELARVPAASPLLVLLDRAPFKGDVPGAGFNNSAEAALLRRYLTAFHEETGGEVWALCGGTPAGTKGWNRLEEGVRYLGLPTVTSAESFDYLLVTLGPEGPVYSWHQAGK
ncbi:MAG TPA: phosphodiester glycosidase family protein [Firmicutes bacterium]|nr:phosphodiester glycosidase family protein [Bacillota bacterium]